jgi:hypothetical protein
MIGFADIIEQGIIPAGLEMMDKFAIEAAEALLKSVILWMHKHYYYVN